MRRRGAVVGCGALFAAAWFPAAFAVTLRPDAIAFLQRRTTAASQAVGQHAGGDDGWEDAEGGTVAALLAEANSALGQVPIVTGCQDLCGIRDQACTTGCQVCVEQWSCTTVLKDCEACLQHTKLTMRRAADSDTPGLFDSGGTPMIKDGIKTELERAEVDEYHSRRELRKSRTRVLEAQRQAEWAARERAQETAHLKEAKLAFEKSRDDVAQWRLRSAKKLKALKVQREKLRQRRENAEQDLKRAEERLKSAEKALDRSGGKREDAEVEKQRKAVKKNELELSEAERDLDKQKQDADWLDRGLKGEVDQSKRGLKAAIMNLRMANAAEIAARYSLEESKKRYVAAADDARKSQRQVRRLEDHLDNATLHEQMLNESLGIEEESDASQQTNTDLDSDEESSDEDVEKEEKRRDEKDEEEEEDEKDREGETLEKEREHDEDRKKRRSEDREDEGEDREREKSKEDDSE
eukprot:TRINITY_DN4803_c0_g1_i1.p1 TRINITY_DN4803_c0_g1~~TRINITY_DN4803_c0_g1_i1.p1  ORF type:complete len:467 (-),score=164.14 TRINITY_DN4803_c0_g1_i1:107-1507(-)